MTNEAAKHLWDLRTAIEPDPPMPEEIGLEERAAIMDEFVEVLVPAARAREIDGDNLGLCAFSRTPIHL